MTGKPGEVVLGRYRIEHQIGRGGFGRIYLARQIALSRAVALKASAADQRGNLAVRERFRREAVLVASISHPNVVTYHDFGTDDEGDMILVMEYLRGRSLYEVIRSGEVWSPADVADMVQQAAEGLFTAHQAGIVHRDVKPSNLFLTSVPIPVRRSDSLLPPSPAGTGFRLKVIDFGILRMDAGVRPDLPDLTAPEAVIGTPAYLAPEMLMGTRSDPRADQYALALVACELMTGRRAFGGPSDPGSFLARLSRVPPELDLVPEGPASVLRRALSPDRDKRYETIVDFAHAFGGQVETMERTRAGVVPAATSSGEALGRQGRAGRRGRRLSARTSIPILLGMAAVGIGAWWLADPGTTSRTVVFPAPSPTTESTMDAAPAPRGPDGPAMADRIGILLPSSPAPVSTGYRGRSSAERSMRANPASRPGAVESSGMPPPAYLTINARPWADVWLDGTPLGRTPVMGRVVTPGSHVIRFEHPTLGTRTVTRTVRPGESLSVTEVLDVPAPLPDSPRDLRRP